MGVIILAVISLLIFFGTPPSDPDAKVLESITMAAPLPSAQFKDFAVKPTDKYPELLKKNNQQYVSELSGFVPTIIEEHDEYVRLYSDMAQTVLNVPKGWYGVDSTNYEGLFLDPSENIILRLGFTDMGSDIKTMEDLERAAIKSLNGMNFEKKVVYTTMHTLSDRQLLIGIKLDPGQSWIVYQLNENKPQFVHKTQLTIRDSQDEKYLGLLGLLLKDQQIIGIKKGDGEDAREKFLKTLSTFDPCYGANELGVKCK